MQFPSRFTVCAIVFVAIVSFTEAKDQNEMRTDWSKRWPDANKMANKDASGVTHNPGWSLPALKFLYEQCKITASGHETTDTDPESGAIAVVRFPKRKGGSGFPARVIAILP